VSVLAALRQRVLPVRLVAAGPPHEPEPHPDEPFAPVYDYRPLTLVDELPTWIRDPRDPDPVVFGPRGSGALQGLHPAGLFGSFGWCGPCGVGWRGDDGCWICGEAT
jgi:hypothetical protein